jgi:endonuclease/exonuclease/phosphatase family metal-dependent hydrolase
VAPAVPAIGIALLSRLPVDAWHVLRLPTVPVRRRLTDTARSRRRAPLSDEPRVCIAAEVRTPTDTVLVATTHLTPVAGWSEVQLGVVTRWLEGFGMPSILLGDLNLERPEAGWATGWQSLVEAPTFPAGTPVVQLDHVLAHGVERPVETRAAHRLPVSDHLAVSVDLAG